MQVPGTYQKTPGWEKEKREDERVSASESCVAASLPGYPGATPMSLYRKIIQDKKDLKEPPKEKKVEFTGHFDHGNFFEPMIISTYKAMTGYELIENSFWVHKDYRNYVCSPDAVCCVNNKPVGLLEAKAPFKMQYGKKKDLDWFDEEYFPIKLVHMCQMQYSLFVTDLEWVDFMSVKYASQPLGIKSETSTLFYRVYRSEPFIRFLVKRVNIFIKCLRKGVVPNRKMYPPYKLPEVKYEIHPMVQEFLIPPQEIVTQHEK